MSTLPTETGSVFTLRLYNHDEHQEPVSTGRDQTKRSLRLRLTEVFEREFLPLWIEAQALDAKTRTLYQNALDWWVKLTDDPPLSIIDDHTVSHFVAELVKQPGRKNPTMAIGTVRKHCTHINKLLTFCGPKTRDKKGRKNLALLDLPPLIDKPYPDYDPPDGDFTLDEVHKMFAACGGTRAPNVDGVSPVSWWRAYIVVACYTGLRLGQMMRLRYSDLAAPYILVPARSSKGRRGKKQYLTVEALDDIEAIRTERCYVFEWPNWFKNPRSHHEVFKRILTRAKIPKDRQFGFNGFRKLHATLVADQDAGTNGIAAAGASLGHTTARTAEKHYVNGRVKDKMTAAAIDRLPSPKPKPKVYDPKQTAFEFDDR